MTKKQMLEEIKKHKFSLIIDKNLNIYKRDFKNNTEFYYNLMKTQNIINELFEEYDVENKIINKDF